MRLSARSPISRALIVMVAALVLAAGHAEARAGRGGGSFGSRGSRTFQAPPPTQTAPSPAAPIQRSTTPQLGPTATNPGMAAGAAAARPGFFSGRGGFMGGLLGAGLFGMLLGYGLFGGLGGLGSIIGLLLQVALVVIVARLAFRWFQRRNQPAFAGAAAGPGAPLRRDAGPARNAGGGSAMPPRARARDELGIGQPDLDQFERTLAELQAAYTAEDMAALRRLATPEVVGVLGEELAENARRGVVNHVADVRLLQGDVAESWREAGQDYATVAMRFGHRDWTTDRATGRVVEGSPDRPVEATELWTFIRPRGGRWLVSAIQPA